jgi:elongation of very long chain fatty acids protein 6
MPKKNSATTVEATPEVRSKAVDQASARDPAAKSKPRRSSKVGDSIFAAFLAVFVALMWASFQGQLPAYSWEKLSSSEAESWARWMIETWWLPLLLSGVYVVLTFGIQWYMADKKAMDLRVPLGLWSLLLALFSIAGAVRTVPVMFQILSSRGVMHLVCGDTRFEWLTTQPAGYWTLLFCLSKIPELVDTAFIVLRKKSLITLHWYHHFTVMTFCWHSWSTCCVNGIIFAAMNLTVHTIMYLFYALTAFGYRPSTFASSITAGQISQMVVGTAVTMYVTMDKVFWVSVSGQRGDTQVCGVLTRAPQHPVAFDISLKIPEWFYTPQPIPDGGPCHVSSGNALAGFLMYGSYLALFMDFFYKAYLKPGAKGERGGD